MALLHGVALLLRELSETQLPSIQGITLGLRQLGKVQFSGSDASAKHVLALAPLEVLVPLILGGGGNPLSFLFGTPGKTPAPNKGLMPKAPPAPTPAKKVAESAPKAKAPAEGGASDADANAADAQKWIDAWQAEKGDDVLPNAREAQKWIDAWSKNKK